MLSPGESVFKDKFWLYPAFIGVYIFLNSVCLLSQDQSLGSWRLKRRVGEGDEIAYKFSPKFVLKAGQTVTVRTFSFHFLHLYACHVLFSVVLQLNHP